MVPATQPAQASSANFTSTGSGSISTMSETANRPPGLSTRRASLRTTALSAARLITQFEITTSTVAGGRGMASIVPLRNVAFGTPARSLFSLARASISSVISTPYAWPPGDTRWAESSTSRPAPLPRSRTTSPGCNSASIVGFPQPRLAPNDSPSPAISDSEYACSPIGPLTASEPAQQPASQQPPLWLNWVAVSEYLARTDSRIVSMLTSQRIDARRWNGSKPIDNCQWNS